MTTIQARYVRRPRGTYRCDWCAKPLADHIYAYGHADDRTPPFGLRLHVGCVFDKTDTRLQAAVQHAQEAQQS